MKIAFLWNFSKAKEIYPNWRDGHRAMIEELGRSNEVSTFLAEDCNKVPDEYAILLFWTDCNDPIVDKFKDYKAKKVLLLTSDNGLSEHIKSYDLVSCESKVVFDKVKTYGVKCIQAMATDTEFYRSAISTKDKIKYFYPATFSPWKLQSSIAYLGKDLLCVGTVQPDGEKELKACLDAGVTVLTGYFPAEDIRDYYNRAECVVIPAIHGSERTVLEAMSMNIHLAVNPLNEKACSYIDEYKRSPFKTTREFVTDSYNAYKFAGKLLKAINGEN